MRINDLKKAVDGNVTLTLEGRPITVMDLKLEIESLIIITKRKGDCIQIESCLETSYSRSIIDI